MKKSLLSALVLVGLNFVSNVEAKDQYVGPNFSGIYSCKGTNNKVGEYEVVATLKLNRISSHGSFGVYDLILRQKMLWFIKAKQLLVDID
jgi:hypothetical protein